jgi:hypothetical protein
LPPRTPRVPEPEKSPQSQKNELAFAIARGAKIGGWAKVNNVPRRTAYRWAGDPKVRAKVEACRRRALDRAIGQFSSSVNSAAQGINELARTAVSESVKLAALKTVFSNMMAVSEFADLKDRITELEEQTDEFMRAGGAGQAG